LENKGAAPFAEERRHPGDKVRRDPAFPQDAGQSVVLDVVEPRLDVQEQGGDLKAWPLKGFDVVGEGEAGVIGTEPWERAALVGVQQPFRPGCCEEAGCDDPFQDFRKSADEDYNPEGGGGLVGGFPWLV